MNAKELAETIRRDADHIESYHGVVNPSYMRAMADVAELLVPKYRPPQPSDDGQWCLLQMMHHLEPRLYQIALRPDGVCLYRNDENGCWYDIVGGVWPCERPE